MYIISELYGFTLIETKTNLALQLARLSTEPLCVSKDVYIIFAVCPIDGGRVKVAITDRMAKAARKDDKTIESVRVFIRAKL